MPSAGALQPRERHAGRGVEPARRKAVHDRILRQLLGLHHHPAASGIRHPRREVVVVVRVVGGDSEDHPAGAEDAVPDLLAARPVGGAEQVGAGVPVEHLEEAGSLDLAYLDGDRRPTGSSGG